MSEAAWRRRIALATAGEGSRQLRVEGADHSFTGKHQALARSLAEWLRAVLGPPG